MVIIDGSRQHATQPEYASGDDGAGHRIAPHLVARCRVRAIGAVALRRVHCIPSEAATDFWYSRALAMAAGSSTVSSL